MLPLLLSKIRDGYISISKYVNTISDLDKATISLCGSLQKLERLGIELVKKQKGGKNGGGAELTEYGKTLLKKFNSVEKDIKDIMQKKYSKF